MSSRAAHMGSIRIKPALWRRLGGFVSFIAGLYLVLAFMPFSVKMTNSESVGHSVFIVTKANVTSGGLHRGDYVTVLDPSNPGSGTLFVKQVVGLPGDQVHVRGRSVYIGERHYGEAKTHARTGRALDVTQGGIIPDGFVYIFGGSVDSYDSRYAEIGFVPLSYLKGTARPVL